MAKNEIEITGPFTRVKVAPIDITTADRVKSNDIELYELDEMIEENDLFFSLYGADFDAVSVTLPGVFDFSNKIENWYRVGTDIKGQPEKMFLEGDSIDLITLDKNTIFALLVENYEGDERRIFNGKFEATKLDISRVNIRHGQEIIADVIQVNYEDAEIIDETQGEFHSLLLLIDGKIHKAPY